MKVYHVNTIARRPLGLGYTRPASPVSIDFTLKKVEKGLLFQVNYQSPAVSDFLRNNRFQASNGLIIASSEFPEFKESKNTVYLWGSDSTRNGKLDATSFTHNFKRDSKYDMLRQALVEFVEFVQSRQPRFVPSAYNCVCF